MTIALFVFLFTLNSSDSPKDKAVCEAEFREWAMDRHWDEEYHTCLKYLKIYQGRARVDLAYRFAKLNARFERV